MNTKKLTVQYAILQGCYWAGYCAINSFAAVFLLHAGLKSSEVGVVMALSNVLGVILQSVFASAADRAKRVTLQQITAGIAAGMMLLLILMQCMSGLGLILGITVTYLLINAFLQVMQPLINSISMYYVNHGIYVDFGIGRGMGSVAFAVASSFLGVLIDKYYGFAIAACGCVILLVLIITLFTMPVIKNEKNRKEDKRENTVVTERKNENSRGGMWRFVCHYKNYMFVLAGLTLVYIEHIFVNTYLIQVVNNLGGNTKQLGVMMTVSAISEMPTMFLFSRLIGRWNSRQLISFAAVMFTVKAVLYFLCTSLSFLYVVQMMQMLAFALCLPATVYYVNETMEPEDKVKGQSLIAATNTLAGVFGSLLGGVLLDAAGVKVMLASGMGISAVGTVIVCIFVFRKDN